MKNTFVINGSTPLYLIQKVVDNYQRDADNYYHTLIKSGDSWGKVNASHKFHTRLVLKHVVLPYSAVIGSAIRYIVQHGIKPNWGRMSFGDFLFHSAAGNCIDDYC